RYPNVDAIERHLLAAYLPAVYRQIRRTPKRSWDGDRAQKWLIFLARHLNHLGTRDLAWWRLRYGAFSGRVRAPKNELVPRRTLLRASGRRVLRAFMAWLVIVLVYGLVLGPFQKLADGHVGLLVTASVVSVATAVVGIALRFTAGLTAPADVTATARIRDSIAADRVSAVFLGLAVRFPLGLWNVLYGYIAAGLGGVLQSECAGGRAAGLAGALGFRLRTAWGRWLTSVRFWLPVTGRLPWRVTGFLDDAHRRGVLRQVGAVYQFRHARL